jgi:hypothetical protein
VPAVNSEKWAIAKQAIAKQAIAKQAIALPFHCW